MKRLRLHRVQAAIRVRKTHPLMATIGLCLVLVGGSAQAKRFDAAELLSKAIDLMEQGQYSLARAYLEPALIHHRITAEARSHAYYLRGYSYYAQNLYVSARKDYNRALEFNPDNAEVQAALGGLYFNGQGVPRDLALALTLYERAAELGNAQAMFHLGYAHTNGIGVEQDLAIGRQWLNKAANAGDAVAMTHLGASYRAEATDSPDPKLALSWYDKAIEAGHASAMIAKAYMLKSGELGEPDPEAARILMEEAAASGSDNAKVSLSYLYLTGDGVPEDPSKAYQLLSQASAGNSPEVYFRLGHLQQYGLGTEANLEAAMASFKRAAVGGISDAMSRLAYLLMNRPDNESQSEAGYWLAQATQSNTADAYNEYAWFLATSPYAAVRNGSVAVTNARKAVAIDANASYLDTLAAAYAEAGQFSQAQATQERAIALAERDQPEVLDDLNAHLEAYRAGQAWREPPLKR